MLRSRFVTLATLVGLAAGTAGAAGAQATAPLAVRPESKVSLSGTSTLHAWTCASSQLSAKIAVDPAALTQGAVAPANTPLAVKVDVPVKAIKCEKGAKMEENLYKALKADANPSIDYVLETHTVVPGATADQFTIRTTGRLTVAGQSKTISMDVAANRLADGGAQGTARLAILMTDFGIKPPVMMLGTLRVGNEVKIDLNVKLSRETVVALSDR